MPVLCLMLLPEVSSAGRPKLPVEFNRSQVVDYLNLLNSNLTTDQLDKIMASDAISIGNLKFSRLEVSQSDSLCVTKINIGSMDPMLILNDLTRKGQYEYQTRLHCLAAVNFALNRHVSKDQVLARESYDCSITRAKSGRPGAINYYRAGEQETMVERPMNGSDNVTPFDNARDGIAIHLPAEGYVEASCQINSDLFNKSPGTQPLREAWRA